MVVLDGATYSSASEAHPTQNELHHRRYPSIPTIKDFDNRGTVLQATLQPHHEGTSNYHYNNTFNAIHETEFPAELGQAPSIISTISPTVTRKPSKIKSKKRFMFSPKEMKSNFFYPVNGPKRTRSRHRAKYRNKMEMDSILDYIRIDSSMSKDLCLNQTVRAFDVKRIYMPNPQLKENIKAITVDSNNNYIIYTPNPTFAKNSMVSADKLLEAELIKLGSSEENDGPGKSNKNSVTREPKLPVPDKALLRTYSLPTSVQNYEKLHAVWNLYLRRVIAQRIQWRLKNTSTSTLSTDYEDAQSLSSSVDTNFFINNVLKGQDTPSEKYKSPRNTTIDPDTSRPLNVYKSRSSLFQNSSNSYSTNSNSPRRAAMLDSLEQLMVEVNSIISVLN